jgi:D-alanyl-D-alanine carboxypeptidase
VRFLKTKKSLGLLLGILLSVTFLLNGCGRGNQQESLYHIEDVSLSKASAFSENLCVVPLGEDNGHKKSLLAASSLIFDITDQSVLYAENIYQKLYPASVTKIMTALVALKYGHLSDTVTISYEASHIAEWDAKKCGFQEGDKVLLKDLLYAFLIYSGNDAGVAIAEHISGSVEAFAALMNLEAKALGATQSNFVNPHGLHDDDHYTTTYDIYLIFQECIKNDTFVEIIHSPSYTLTYEDKKGEEHTVTYTTTNRYLNGKEAEPKGVTVIGGKTGTTQKAGSCLVLLSENKEGHSFISVIFKSENGDSLFSQMSQLLKME